MSKVQLAQANAIHIPLPDDSVHCVITSPPFFGLRVYEGVEPSVWADGWRGCLGNEPDVDLYISHLVQVFREVKRVLHPSGVLWLNLGFSYAGSWGNYAPGGIKSKQRPQTEGGKRWERKAYGDTGFLPSTANAHGYKPKDLIPIPWLVAIALQRDGWWLRSAPPWLKRNCLPESVTDRPTTSHEQWLMFTKSARYFWDAEAVRMPGSTNSHGGGIPGEHRYTHQSGRNDGGSLSMGIPATSTGGRNRRTSDTWFESLDALISDQRCYLAHLRHVRDNGGMLLGEDGQPLGLVFDTKGYSGAHFATFPPDMIRPLIKASTSKRGVCPRCGAPWERVVEKGLTAHNGKTECTYQQGTTANRLALLRQAAREQGTEYTNRSKTTGWQPTCACYRTCDLRKRQHQDVIAGQLKALCDRLEELEDLNLPADFPMIQFIQARIAALEPLTWEHRVITSDAPTVPATVLDPFIGSGTTCLVARDLGRNSVGLDASHTYLAKQSRPRLELDRLAAWGNDNGRQPTEATWQELPLFAQ